MSSADCDMSEERKQAVEEGEVAVLPSSSGGPAAWVITGSCSLPRLRRKGISGRRAVGNDVSVLQQHTKQVRYIG